MRLCSICGQNSVVAERRREMTLKPKRVSDSPLIDPTVTCLVLIAPDPDDLMSVGPHAEADVQRKLRALALAADIIEIPVLVASPGPSRRLHSLVGHLPRMASHHQFSSGEDGVPWFNTT